MDLETRIQKVLANSKLVVEFTSGTQVKRVALGRYFD